MRALLLLLALPLLTPGAAGQEGFVMIHAVDQEGEYLFLPDNATVVPGATISVMAFGQEPHAMRAVDGSFDTGPLDPNDAEGYETTLTAPATPGDYPFYCPYHASASTPTGTGMTGLLVVEERAAPTPTHADPAPTSAGSPPVDGNATSLPFSAALAGLALAAMLLRRG